MADSSVKFDKNGDGIARYTIYNYQKRLSDGATDYKVIGKWMDGLGKYTQSKKSTHLKVHLK